MSFLHPWVLLLLVVPITLGWAVLLRPAGVTLPIDHASHRRRRVLGSLLGVFDALPLLILAVVIIILAGPQRPQTPREARELTNIQICLDVSGSMAGPRYELATEAISSFTRQREGDAMGLTFFGTGQIRWIPLTRDLQAIRNATPFADPMRQPRHMMGTMIGAALDFCRQNIEAETSDEPGDRVIIVVSDGQSFDLGDGQEFEVAERLRASGITVFHIHVAEDEDIPPEMVELARLTGGDAMVATDPEAMRQVFRHIDRMKPARFKVPSAVPMDDFFPFAIAGLVLAGLHLVGLLGVRYTPW
ncbi:MAG: VWA domain-containing protein [Phycisphaeraceae bacterium]|nr:VWA domain-containing protein [Phycisphaeraceae bacterium]